MGDPKPKVHVDGDHETIEYSFEVTIYVQPASVDDAAMRKIVDDEFTKLKQALKGQ